MTQKLCYRHFTENDEEDGKTLAICYRQGLTTNSLGYCKECWQDFRTMLDEIDEEHRVSRISKISSYILILLFIPIGLAQAEPIEITNLKIKAPKTSKVEYSYAEIKCLTLTVLGEAGGSRYTSASEQRRVAFTVLKRVQLPSYPNSICGVVSQRKQFQGYTRITSKPYPALVTQHYMKVMRKLLESWDETNLNWKSTHFYGVQHKKPYWAKSKPIICSKWHCYLAV